MRYSRIVVTCGVSVFGTGSALRNWVEEEGLLTFPKSSSFPNPEPPEGETPDEAVKAVMQKAHPQVLARVISDKKRVSAEYSALLALRSERHLADNPQVVLIHTATLGGRAGAVLLKALIQEEFKAHVECSECSLNVDDRDQLQYDLGNYMEKVASALKVGDRYSTCFAPIGGYKVMTSLGSLAGGFLGFPSIYLHEEKQVFHIIPGVPWKLSQDAIKELAPLFKKANSAIAVEDLTESERTQLEEHPWLFERTDNFVAVNAFGDFVMRENPAIFGTKLLVSGEVDQEFGNDGRRAFIKQQLGVLSVKLATGSTHADLNHEGTWNVPINDDWHLYKGASNGQQVMRAVYRYDRDQNALTVKDVWTNHDNYEREFETAWNSHLGAQVEWSLE